MSVGREMRAGLLPAIVIGAAILGCSDAHYVVKKPDYGVVAIPHDTPELRAEAEELMHKHFPHGYVIERQEIVPVGESYTTYTPVSRHRAIEEVHQNTEVMITYRPVPPSGAPVARAPLAPTTAPVQQVVRPMPPPSIQQVGMPPPSVPTVEPAVHVAPAPPPAATPPGLPPEPVPVGPGG